MERFMEFEFVAAQQLPGVPADHTAARLHGHTFRVRVSLAAALDPDKDWIIDPAELRAQVEQVLGDVDHRYLNEVPMLDNPSTENLTRYLRDRLRDRLPGQVTLELWENEKVGCTVS